MRTLEGHTNDVNAVAITPDGNTAVSGSDDNTLRVWDVATGELVVFYPLDSAGTSVAVTKDDHVIAGTASGQLHFLMLCNRPF